MQAIEFTVTSQNGIIKIPQSYKDWFGKSSIRVILLIDTGGEPAGHEADNTELRQFFDQFTANVTNYRFDREEANAR